MSTIGNCHLIYELAGGGIVVRSNYGELLESSPSFRAMAIRVQG